MTVRPIPKRLLLHSVIYEEFIQDDYGNSYQPSQSIANVRLEPKNAIVRSNIRDDDEGTTLLFVDSKHSMPFIRPVERSRITFDGTRYEVTRVNEFWADSATIHHIEVELK